MQNLFLHMILGAVEGPEEPAFFTFCHICLMNYSQEKVVILEIMTKSVSFPFTHDSLYFGPFPVFDEKPQQSSFGKELRLPIFSWTRVSLFDPHHQRSSSIQQKNQGLFKPDQALLLLIRLHSLY